MKLGRTILRERERERERERLDCWMEEKKEMEVFIYKKREKF